MVNARSEANRRAILSCLARHEDDLYVNVAIVCKETGMGYYTARTHLLALEQAGLAAQPGRDEHDLATWWRITEAGKVAP